MIISIGIQCLNATLTKNKQRYLKHCHLIGSFIDQSNEACGTEPQPLSPCLALNLRLLIK